MFEYDNEQKIRSLIIWGFDVENLDVDKIVHVPMHQYRVATKERPMLYVDNLQCCVGFYAYSDNFAFVAHVNPKIMREDDYKLSSDYFPLSFNRINNLRKTIFENYPFNEPIRIGISLGSNPLSKYYPTMEMIYKSIENLIKELESKGIKVQKLEDIFAPEFILNLEDKKIIVPKKTQKDKTSAHKK